MTHHNSRETAPNVGLVVRARDTYRMGSSDWVALASVAVAALAIVFGFLGTLYSQKRQLALAADERLWQRRADVYVEMLEYSNVITDRSLANFGEASDVMSLTLYARVQAFADEQVFHAFRGYLNLYDRWRGTKTPEAMAASIAAHHALQDAVRADLGTIRKRRRRGKRGAIPAT